MQQRTVDALAKLRRADWFRNVGVRDTQHADVLSSWQAAIESCASLDWENLGLDAANEYRARLRRTDPRALSTWNDAANSLRPLVLALVREKTRAVVEANQLPKVFTDNVNWDIMHYFLECEYGDICAPSFFAAKADWYLKGHFPCGWRGPLAGGRFLIY